MSVHWVKADIAVATSRSDFDRRVRPLKPTVGVVKSLALIGAGPVGLVHTHRVGIKYKKPPRLAPTEFSQNWFMPLLTSMARPLTSQWRYASTNDQQLLRCQREFSH